MNSINQYYEKSKITILCVDDEEFILTMLKRIFSLAGYVVLTTNSPQECIEIAKQKKIDVLIADYQMPEMNGVQVVREIQTFNSKAIKIILTGEANEADLEAAVKDQIIKKWLLKPINPRMLKVEIEHLLFPEFKNEA